MESANVVWDALEEFKDLSGLVPSIPNSKAYNRNVPNVIKQDILITMLFEECTLPLKYLGVLLISLHLLYRDCKFLIERIQICIVDWKNKSLSFAGRLQLIMSILSSMHIYWASVFILPSLIILDLEQYMRGFLWCQGEMKKGRAKVAWETMCKPKSEGGLGIKRLEEFNLILNGDWIWSTHWYTKYPNLVRALVPTLNSDVTDRVLWRDLNGIFNQFSVLLVWQCIRKLKTHDRLKQLDVSLGTNLNLLQCPLCDLVPDSHNHLFFECSFLMRVWSMVRMLSGMDYVPPRFEDVVEFFYPKLQRSFCEKYYLSDCFGCHLLLYMAREECKIIQEVEVAYLDLRDYYCYRSSEVDFHSI
ncbi:hypothetical protein Tco_0318449 [Tanacetum coccineum]